MLDDALSNLSGKRSKIHQDFIKRIERESERAWQSKRSDLCPVDFQGKMQAMFRIGFLVGARFIAVESNRCIMISHLIGFLAGVIVSRILWAFL